MLYTVFSTTHSPYQDWQSELLEYSWDAVGQPGELIRLVATSHHQDLPRHLHAKVVPTWPWDIHPLTGDRYLIYNKPASLFQWLMSKKPEGTVLFIDPDCVFRAAIPREVPEGNPVSQPWVSLHGRTDYPLTGRPKFEIVQRYCKRNVRLAQEIMIPTLIHTNDLKRIVPRWLEVTAQIRQGVKDQKGSPLWESDMFGYIIAAAEAGLIHEEADLGVCTHWSPLDVPNAPIIHYCHPIHARDHTKIWDKHTYQPWNSVWDPQSAQHGDGGDLLSLLNRFIQSRNLKVCLVN